MRVRRLPVPESGLKLAHSAMLMRTTRDALTRARGGVGARPHTLSARLRVYGVWTL